MGRIKKIVVILGGKKLSGSKTQNISELFKTYWSGRVKKEETSRIIP